MPSRSMALPVRVVRVRPMSRASARSSGSLTSARISPIAYTAPTAHTATASPSASPSRVMSRPSHVDPGHAADEHEPDGVQAQRDQYADPAGVGAGHGAERARHDAVQEQQ